MADKTPDGAGAAGAGAPGAGHRQGRNLTEGPIGRTLLLFALPTLGSNILQSLNGSINAVWVGRFLGEDALAATANGNILMFLLLAFVFGFGMAGTILIGQATGRRDIVEVRRVFGTTMGSFLPILLAIATLGWIFAPELLRLLATPEGTTIAWAHFLTFDLFVGRWVYLESRERDLSVWLMAPVLFFVLMLGPLGLLLYFAVRGRQA